MTGFAKSIGGASGNSPINATSMGVGRGGSGAACPELRTSWGNGKPNPNVGASSAGGDASRFASLGGRRDGKK